MQHFNMQLMQAFIVFPRLNMLISLCCQLIEPPLLPIKILAHATDVGLLFIDLLIDDLDLNISLAFLLDDVI
jgi:hypothetical protein